jgi:leucyl aminopeptidase (aminopeptidase T)
MFRRSRSSVIGLLAVAAFVGSGLDPGPALGQEQGELASRLVNSSANVEPGDHVVIAGGKHTLDLMEQIAIEAQKAGGMVDMMLTSDEVLRSYWTDVSDEYIQQVPTHWEAWLNEVDVWIGLPGIEDPAATFGAVSEEKFALASESNQFFNDKLNATPLRGLGLAYPTEAVAKENGLDYETYSAMQWAAIRADYDAISAKGKALAAKLKGAREIRVTSPAGTDLRFSQADRPVFLDDGIVTPEEAGSEMFLERWASLPGGQVFTSVDEGSASGTVVVPNDRCRFEPMTGIRFAVEDGYIQDFQAEENGACFKEVMAPYDETASRLGYLDIGLNPELKVIEDGEADYRPGNAAGMVSLGFGDNQLVGGQNVTTGGYGFPVVNATVTVDGTDVVKDGALVED